VRGVFNSHDTVCDDNSAHSTPLKDHKDPKTLFMGGCIRKLDRTHTEFCSAIPFITFPFAF